MGNARGFVKDEDVLAEFEKLTPKRQAFALGLCRGMTQYDAYRAAGFSTNGKRSSVAKCANILAQNPVIQKYVAANRIVSTAAMTPEAIMHRMEAIMNGNILVTVATRGQNKMSVPPSFADQINAAKLLFEILKYNETKHPSTQGSVIIELDEELEAKTRKLLNTKISSGEVIDNGEDKE